MDGKREKVCSLHYYTESSSEETVDYTEMCYHNIIDIGSLMFSRLFCHYVKYV